MSFPSKAAFTAWLAENHDTSDGIWIKIAKKGTGVSTCSAPEALDVALCFGWIDGQRKSLDDTYFLQKYTPRRARSKWSQVNVSKVTALIERGAMRPAGLAEIERAKADGRWAQAYDAPSTAEIPEDFLAELEKHPKAKAFFATLNKRNTYPVVHRLQTARTPEVRAARIRAMIEMFERGERFYD